MTTPKRWLMSASFDGLTFLHDKAWECKSLNDTIRKASSINELHLCYKVQMTQQMMISGAKKCYFTGVNFTKDGELIERVSFWYDFDPVLAEQIKAGWNQLEKEIREYQMKANIEPVIVEEVSSLPVPFAQVEGRLVSCNLETVTPLFDKFLTNAVRNMVTDEDFALAEAQSKRAREAAKQCRAVARSIVDQMASIGEATRVLEAYADKLDSLGLFQEKGVKTQKDLLKNNARKEYEKKWYDYRQEVQNALGMTVVMDMRDEPDFVEAMKGQRMMSSVHNKLNTELARAKIALDGIALDYSEKLGWFHASPRPNIFHDLQSLVSRLPLEDFQSAVNSRIEKFEIEQKEKVLELAREQAVQNLTVAIEDVKDKVQDIHDKHNLIVDQVETFIALGGIPDDLITFVRVTLTRFVRWQNG